MTDDDKELKEILQGIKREIAWLGWILCVMLFLAFCALQYFSDRQFLKFIGEYLKGY